MASKEITLWVDARWYNALSKSLKDNTVEKHLENVIDEMCGQLPREEYETIRCEIQEEDRLTKQEAEANRRFAIFHVTEGARSEYFLVEETLEFLPVANRLRTYIQSQDKVRYPSFFQLFWRSASISEERFDDYVHERMDNTGRVTGAYRIDLNSGTFEALSIMDGWQCYTVKDVSTAAYHGYRTKYDSAETRWNKFLDYLQGRELTAYHQPFPYCVTFSEEICENNGVLDFYINTDFDVDQVFGTDVCTTENEDWLNVYANLDLNTGQVRDTLTLILHRGDGADEERRYSLSETERAVLLKKMEQYCMEQTGMSLGDHITQYRQEQQENEMDEVQEPEVKLPDLGGLSM